MEETTNNIVVDRDYVDTFSIKELATEHILPTYFPDQPSSNLTVGTIGMIGEYIATVTEDSFNTGSSLVTETFPTRAKMESSIYANAAVFQLTNAFSDGGLCDFLIAIPESDIYKNFIEKPGSSYKYFYLDKNTKILVNGISFVLDYDIEIRATYRETQNGWIYTAKYMMDEYTNSTSVIKDPYVKLRKTTTGLVVLQVTMRQYYRHIVYESIIDNATLNYPTIRVSFGGKLMGFDILYKSPTDSDYNTQLEPRVIYSLPSKSPFCYYRMIGDQIIEFSFTTNSAYFQPKFNSEVKIILYLTDGEDGNFDAYDGTNIIVSKGDAYEYANSWILTAKPISGCFGGKEKMSLEGLKALTVEGYSTANALTTEHDLQVYFNNYTHRYNKEIFIVKKRNDAVGLLFSAFMFIKYDDYIYPTNTLTLDSNVQYLDYKDGGFYVIDPGYLFGYKSIDAFYMPQYYINSDGLGGRYTEDGLYYNEVGEYTPEKNITPDQLQTRIENGYLIKAERCYYTRGGADEYLLHHTDGSFVSDATPLTAKELYDKFMNDELICVRIGDGSQRIDFIIDEVADAAARKDYINYYPEYAAASENPDMSLADYLFLYTFKDYKKDNGIDTRRTIFDENIEAIAKEHDFLFVNPFILTIEKENGLISYFQSYISEQSAMDFVKENDEDSFVQFITYTLHVDRVISEKKKYHIKLTVLPSVSMESSEKYCNIIYDESNDDNFIGDTRSLSSFNKEKLVENRLRVMLTFNNGDSDVGYMELIPTDDTTQADQIVFEGEFYTDDYITSANTFRITHVCPYCGHEILNSANFNIDSRDYYCDNCGNHFKEGIINMKESDSLLLPVTEALITITTLFRDPENDEYPITDNEFVKYDESYRNYIWTNIYNTYSEPITFIEPLNMMRSVLTYKDYYQPGVDALDCMISDIPLLKYSVVAYRDASPDITDPLLADDIGKLQYFMQAFSSNYGILKEARTYLNGMNIDAKFYNTYGRSTNFVIGENEEIIDTNNISIAFDVWVDIHADILECEQELKVFIKDYIERVNDDGSNSLYISNLIREIENNFAYVHHLRFKGINSYDVSYQSIINKSIALENLTKEQRRQFVPDLLVINTNNVYLRIFQEQ